MMDECLKDVSAVLERERRTLEWIRSKAVTIHRLMDLYKSAEEACRRFDAKSGMGVYLKWQTEFEGRNRDPLWLHVGGIIQVANDAIANMSYYLCVTRFDRELQQQRVLRKFHFDYASPAVRSQRRSSVFHLQYPGKLPPEMTADKDEGMEVRMDAWLEVPRIFFLPMSLSLVLHLAFREFPDRYTNRLCEDGDWQSVFVHRDQTCLILPYLQDCVSIATDPKKKLLLWDCACNPDSQ
jgi:hypothetical protein